MAIHIEYETDLSLGIEVEDIICKVIDTALDMYECPYEAEVNITITDNEEIKEINAKCRTIDRATDVLSFPMINYEVPGDFSKVEDDITNFHPESGELLLGDIMISIDKVFEQAEEYGHSVERELGFLTAHSMLHLCGYDHMEEEERAIMEQKQREIMDLVQLYR